METEQKAIEHSAMTIEYLRTKYTNAQLFDWMEGRVRASLYATYTLAYDMAKRAEMAYAFERGGAADDPGASFVGAGTWDAAHDGLLCGDALYLGLKKMDAAYVETRGHDFEITRHVSLRALTPLGLLHLRAKGTVDFALPELLFDMDFPGHYRRRLRSVSLSLPCVVGPYTSVSATLRLLAHRYRYSALGAGGAGDYAEAPGGADARFRTSLVPTTAIAAGSSAQGDAGVFELNFRDERYLPFEGAGAVSQWRLELPADVRLFDYDSIADVLLQVRYTAADGGAGLQQAAADATKAFLGRIADSSGAAPLVALLDLKNDFSAEWHRFAAGTGAAGTNGARTLTLAQLTSRLPFYARPVAGRSPVASRVVLVPEAALATGWGASLRSGTAAATALTEVEGGELPFMQDAAVTMGLDQDWVLELAPTDGAAAGLGALERMWLVVYYSLRPTKSR